MKKLILSVMLILVLTLTVVIITAESVTYDFDDVNVVYAASFTAKPIADIDSSGTWASDLVGDDKLLTITYGIVELKKDGELLTTEEFLKVSGSKGSKRFLINSVTYDYYEGTTSYNRIRSFFWSAKKLEGTSIVKDSTKPIYSASLSRKFDESGNMHSFFLSFSNEGEGASQNFWQDSDSPMYEDDTTTIIESGDATTSSDKEVKR